ncbi:hypothetical protein DIPPA_25674 [Diplonema papillatum]|nr:hypothetical protein DIPPA_25674 [Diplonema papillatum]
MAGVIKETPKLAVSVVDVRDVADLHLRAMRSPKAAGERFLASTAAAVSLHDAARIIKEERPEQAERIADLSPLPPSLYPQLSNRKATATLQWQPRDYKTALLATVDSLVALASA